LDLVFGILRVIEWMRLFFWFPKLRYKSNIMKLLDTAAFEKAWAEGEKLSIEAAMALAFGR